MTNGAIEICYMTEKLIKFVQNQFKSMFKDIGWTR